MEMTDLAMWSLLVGFLLPPVLAVVVQSSWSDRVKSVVAFLASLVAGAGTAYFAGDLTTRTFVSAGLVVLVTAVSTYRNFWKTTGVAPTIEHGTNLQK